MFRTIFAVLCLGIAVVFISLAFVMPKNEAKPIISPFGTEEFISPAQQSEQQWTLLLTGDIIPARVVNQKMTEMNDFYWPLRNIDRALKDADISLINLEAPLLEKCPVTNEGFTFCGDKKFSLSLSEAGIDVANLANNHTLNYGWEGIEETQQYLHDNTIETTGFTTKEGEDLLESCTYSTQCSEFTIKTIHGKTIGFLGYNAVGQSLNEEIVRAEIEQADSLVDILVVSVHWGKEYERTPVADASLAPDDPILLGRKFVDWGADVVAGNHPHWYQTMEWYTSPKGVKKPIFYALGNTIFDQEWSEETKEGVLVLLTFEGGTLIPEKTQFLPIGIRNYGEAYFLEGQKKKDIESFYQTQMNTALSS